MRPAAWNQFRVLPVDIEQNSQGKLPSRFQGLCLSAARRCSPSRSKEAGAVKRGQGLWLSASCKTRKAAKKRKERKKKRKKERKKEKRKKEKRKKERRKKRSRVHHARLAKQQLGKLKCCAWGARAIMLQGSAQPLLQDALPPSPAAVAAQAAASGFRDHTPPCLQGSHITMPLGITHHHAFRDHITMPSGITHHHAFRRCTHHHAFRDHTPPCLQAVHTTMPSGITHHHAFRDHTPPCLQGSHITMPSEITHHHALQAVHSAHCWLP